MPLSKALVQPFRKNSILIGAGWRAFFAPFNSALAGQTSDTTVGPKILDLQVHLPINTHSLPSGWFDLGWIKDFRPTPDSKVGSVRSGYRGAVRAKYRGQVGEMFEFKFRECTRMAYKLASGTSVFNMLWNSSASTVGPLSSSGAAATALSALGYQAAGAGLSAGSPSLFVADSASGTFAVGQYIVVDIDYDPATFGFVGSSGVPVFEGVVTDVDYIRKTSDYVARITSILPNASANQTALVLSQALAGGGSGDPAAITAPPAASKIQRIRGWTAREGGTAITDWSAMFVQDYVDGAQTVLYYPHVNTAQFRGLGEWAIENIGTTDMTGYELDGVFEALAFDDPIDGETVVGYKCFVPRSRLQDPAI